MCNAVRGAVDNLSALSKHMPVDWEAFDAALAGLENINVFDKGKGRAVAEYMAEGRRCLHTSATFRCRAPRAGVQ